MLAPQKTLLALSSIAVLPALTTASYHGKMTWFQPGLGSCGETSTASDAVVAMTLTHNGSNEKCGKQIRVSAKGKSAVLNVVDKCPTCTGANDIDVSPAVFKQFAELGAGMVSVKWTWVK